MVAGLPSLEAGGGAAYFQTQSAGAGDVDLAAMETAGDDDGDSSRDNGDDAAGARVSDGEEMDQEDGPSSSVPPKRWGPLALATRIRSVWCLITNTVFADQVAAMRHAHMTRATQCK